MAAPETKRLYTQEDLASLVAGDRVKLDTGSEDREDNSYLAVYEGSKGNKVHFLAPVHYEGRVIAFERKTIPNENIFFDNHGDLLIVDVEEEKTDYYEISQNRRRHKKELNLLRQARLYGE